MAAKQISEQMELFEEGGLKDEGGMIDEVSGNDVPTGSTREEVRDDIPAQLSEGEFVLPADVVRYHGLEKIMALRDEAKQGLQKMEAMGQMGNSEEATLPDDIPFDIDDLDMEDEDEPQEMEMAEGGYVMVAGKPMPIPRIGGQLPPITTRPMPETKNMAVGGFTGATGTYQVPTNIATQPSYFQNYQQSTAPFQPFVPPQQQQVQQPVVGLQQPQQQTFPSFQTLMPTVGGKRETIEYRNEAGQKLFIPFIDGNPIYPIPEGYTKYVAEEQPIAKDKPITSTTTQVTGQDGSDVMTETTQVATNFENKSPAEVSKSLSNMSTPSRTQAVMSALQESKGYTGFSKAMQQMAAVMTPGVLTSKMYSQKTVNPMSVLSQIGMPNSKALNSITSAFGYNADTATMEQAANPANQLEAMSQAAYGKSLTEMSTQLGGVTPSFTIGYGPGQVDPTTGATYNTSGQAVDKNGDVSYSNFGAFANSMAASGKSGYYGNKEQAKVDAAKGNPRAQSYIDNLNAIEAKQQDEKDKEASTRGGSGKGALGGIGNIGTGYGIGENTGERGSQGFGSETTDPSRGGREPGTGPGTTATGMTTTSGDLGGPTGAGYGGGVSTVGNDPTGPGDPGVGGDSGMDASSGVGNDGGGWTATGGFINKKKMTMHKGPPKAKKRMKRGGLASKK